MQFSDGYFKGYDVMNYMQHHMIAKMAKKGFRVLDMCCGRGLMLPLLRYISPEIESYTGVDIDKSNAEFRTKRVNNGKPLVPGYYPFSVYFCESDVAEMSNKLPADRYDLIIYTSSLEHMHPDVGLKSLKEAFTVAAPGAQLILTCPNTPEDQDGYDTQYAYHVYEWKKSEVLAALKDIGWRLETTFGILSNITTIREHIPAHLRDVFEFQSQYVPSEWLVPIYAMLIEPEHAKELAYICRKE
jgi:ubiquinone/menaquinone biosynthesis C-methylase UbiE